MTNCVRYKIMNVIALHYNTKYYTIYIYYIRERERERERDDQFLFWRLNSMLHGREDMNDTCNSRKGVLRWQTKIGKEKGV